LPYQDRQQTAASTPRRCPACGANVTLRQAYCGDCGLKLPFVALDTGAVQGKVARVDERKRVTVLFADIVGSTAMINGLDPEQAASVLDPIVREMATIIARHGGFVSSLRGDGLKAVFGMPLTREDHAQRACAAALEITDMARAEQAQARVGAHSGEVLVRRLHSEVFDEYDAVGSVVHLAARLEQAAKPSKVWISAATARLLAGRFRLQPRGRHPAKGVPGGIEVFEVTGESRRARWSIHGRDQHGKFVNRVAELKTLIAAVWDPKPVALVSADAGSGKSRLLLELAKRREIASWTVLKVGVEADDAHAGLRPFAQMLRAWLRTGRQEAPAQVRAQLAEHVGAVGGTRQVAAGLQALLDVDEGPLTTSVQKNQIMQALIQLIIGHAERNPVLLLIEDIHSLDTDGLDLLRLLREAATPGRLAIVETSRLPAPSLPGVSHTIALPPLSASESMNLLDATLGAAPALDALKAKIVERAGGIPLFLEQIAKLSIEAVEADSLIPDGIHAVIGERIDRLPESAHTLLRTASVIGHEVPLQVLGRVLDCDVTQLIPRLRDLELGGFIRLATDAPEPKLAFAHALTREVAYTGLLTTDRRVIHGAVLAAYEELYPIGLDVLADQLGAHAVEAGAWQKAEYYLSRAAQKAIDRSYHASATRHINQALHVLAGADHPPDERAELEFALRLLLRTANNAKGNYRERLGNLDRAEELARTIGRPEMLPGLWVSRSSVLLQTGEAESAIALCERARRAALRCRDTDTVVIAGYMLARTCFYAGRLLASFNTAGRTLALLRGGSGSERHGGGFGTSLVMLSTQRAQTGAALGRFEEARRSAITALAAADRSQRSFDIALAGFGVGVVEWYAAEVTGAIDTLERGLAASATEGAQSVHVAIASLLSLAYFRAGRSEDALVLARRVLGTREDSHYFANWPRLFGALILDAHGSRGEALELVAAARRAARNGRYAVQLVWSELVLAELHRETGPAIALRCLTRALAESERMGMRPCIVRALFAAARLRRSTGKEEAAQLLIRRAARLARAIGMRENVDLV
jgi:class 3 adenylate cyclase/tetratricopeptide (TPR) repeat protein